LFFETADDAN